MPGRGGFRASPIVCLPLRVSPMYLCSGNRAGPADISWCVRAEIPWDNSLGASNQQTLPHGQAAAVFLAKAQPENVCAGRRCSKSRRAPRLLLHHTHRYCSSSNRGIARHPRRCLYFRQLLVCLSAHIVLKKMEPAASCCHVLPLGSGWSIILDDLYYLITYTG